MKHLLKVIIKEEIAKAMLEEASFKDWMKKLALAGLLAVGGGAGGRALGNASHRDADITAKASEINNIESLISAVKDIQVDEGTDAAMAIQRLRNAESRREEIQAVLIKSKSTYQIQKAQDLFS